MENSWDALAGGWRLWCPEAAERLVVRLERFRVLEPLAGALRPPVQQVRFACGRCGGTHDALVSERELDWAPLADPLPPAHSLMLGRVAWDPALAEELRIRQLLNGSWPLRFVCGCRPRPVAGWPSALRRIEPDRDERPRRFLVSYRCPSCERQRAEEWSASRFVLVPSG